MVDSKLNSATRLSLSVGQPKSARASLLAKVPWHRRQSAAGDGRDLEQHRLRAAIAGVFRAHLEGEQVPARAEHAVRRRAPGGSRTTVSLPVARSSTRTLHVGAHGGAQAISVALPAITW